MTNDLRMIYELLMTYNLVMLNDLVMTCLENIIHQRVLRQILLALALLTIIFILKLDVLVTII